MSGESSMILLGIGTAGSAMARGVSRAFGGGLRLVLICLDGRQLGHGCCHQHADPQRPRQGLRHG